MSTMTVAQLEEALKMLRRQGVKAYSDTPGGGFTVEFFPVEGPELKEPAKKVDEDDLCPCGHHLGREHMNGFCIHACTTCNPEAQQEQKPQP